MKKVISVLCALMVLSISAFAQGPQGPQGPRRGGDNGWRERVRAEKVAFLTEEIDLTESEAQVFWPIGRRREEGQQGDGEAGQGLYRRQGEERRHRDQVPEQASQGPPRREGRPLLRGRGEIPPPADRPPRERQLPQPPHERRAEAAVEGEFHRVVFLYATGCRRTGRPASRGCGRRGPRGRDRG